MGATAADLPLQADVTRAATAAAASAGPDFADVNAFFARRMADAPIVSPALSRAAQFALLDRLGYDAVADMLAHGALGYEVAHRLDVSPIVFASWWRLAPAEARALAREVSAEAAMAKAEAALSTAPPSKEDAIVQTALATHLHKVAAALDPKTWNAGKTKPSPLTPMALVIAGDMPGLDHMRTSAPSSGMIVAEPVFSIEEFAAAAASSPAPPPPAPPPAPSPFWRRAALLADEIRRGGEAAPEVFAGEADGDG